MIVFDLDGTLVDSAPDLVSSLNAVLARDGIAPLPEARARKFVGRGGRMLIRQGLAAVDREVSDARLEEMFAAFLAHYEDHLSDASRPYPGVETALDRLAADGHRLAVLTNKFERPARMVLRDLGLAGRFETIVGADTFPISKPNGAVLGLTIEKARGDRSRAIMVGDTITDVLTARNAGLPVVVVDFGYAPEPIESLGADAIISSFEQLPGIVAALCEKLPASV